MFSGASGIKREKNNKQY